MTVTNCTGPEAEAAVDHLRAAFDPFYTDAEKRQLKRLFLDYQKSEVVEAIDQLVKQGVTHPRPVDFGAILKSNRKFLRSQAQANTPNPPPGDPDAAEPEETVTLAQLAKACCDRDPEKAAAAQAELDRRTGAVRI